MRSNRGRVNEFKFVLSGLALIGVRCGGRYRWSVEEMGSRERSSSTLSGHWWCDGVTVGVLVLGSALMVIGSAGVVVVFLEDGGSWWWTT